MKNQNNPVQLEGALRGFPSRTLWIRHLKNHWPTYVLGSLAIFATDVTEVMIPKIVQWSIDSIRLKGDNLLELVGLFVGVLLLQFVGRIVWRQTLGQQTHYVAAQMKSKLWNRARYLPQSRLESDLSPGELMNVATGDVGVARFTFGFSWVGTLDFIALIIMTVTSMCLIDWKLALLLLSPNPLLPFFLNRLSKRESQQHKVAQESLSALTDLAAQAVGTAKLQRLSQSNAFWVKRLYEAASEYRKKRVAVVFTSIDFIPYTGIAPLISFALLVYFGVPKVISGELSLGAFVALQTYVFMIQVPLFELGTLISEWQRGFSSLDRITHTFSQKESDGLRSGGIQPTLTPAVYSIKNLSFAFPGGTTLFKNLSLNIKQGERLGIYGAIGTGKSTFIQILAGFETRFQGEVQLYGKEIKHYSHAALRNILAVVPQKPFLFADTLFSNIQMNREYSEEEIWHFLELAGLADDIKQFPDKLQTKLGEWGVNLSGGQKQRMTLARALATKPEILLLDDCLSAVDTVTEEKILNNLDKHLKNTTLVWVAHRASTLRYCSAKIEFSNTNNQYSSSEPRV